MEKRIALKLPPGYKDASKADDGIGDVIIWHTLKMIAKRSNGTVIFVTGEEKADWMVRSQKDGILPRPELIHEMFVETQQHFCMVSWPVFLEIAKVPQIVIEEVRQAEIQRMLEAYKADRGLKSRISGPDLHLRVVVQRLCDTIVDISRVTTDPPQFAAACNNVKVMVEELAMNLRLHRPALNQFELNALDSFMTSLEHILINMDALKNSTGSPIDMSRQVALEGFSFLQHKILEHGRIVLAALNRLAHGYAEAD